MFEGVKWRGGGGEEINSELSSFSYKQEIFNSSPKASSYNLLIVNKPEQSYFVKRYSINVLC